MSENRASSDRTGAARFARAQWPWTAMVVVVAVTVGVFVWGGRDRSAQASAGQVLEATDLPVRGDGVLTRSLRLPYGEISIRTTPPDSHAPVRAGVADVRAPEGGSFIGITVASDVSRRLTQPAVADVAEPTVEVALLVGTRRYRIPAPFRTVSTNPTDRKARVAVDGHPGNVRVAVTYDGVTQSVDMRTGARVTGAAAPLYRLLFVGDRPTGPCGAPTVAGGFRIDGGAGSIRCTVQTLGGLPYLPGRGWAPQGRVWFTALVGLFDDARFRRDGRYYRATSGGSGPVVTAAVSGGTPAAVKTVTPTQSLPSGAAGRLVAFPVRTGTTPTVRLIATYRDLVGYGAAPARTVATGPTAVVTWTVTS